MKAQKIFKTYLFFPFVAFDYGIISKETLPNPRSQRFTPIFSSKSFIVLGLRIYFELILRYSKRVQPHPLACGHPVVLEPFVEKMTLSPIGLSWHSYKKNHLTTNVSVYFLTFSSVQLLYPTTILPHYLIVAL